MNIIQRHAALGRPQGAVQAGSAVPKQYSVRFSGIKEDLEKNRDDYEHQLFVKYLNQNMYVLSKPVLKIGSKGINGLELLQLVDNATKNKYATYYSSLWKDYSETLYPPAERANHFDELTNAFRKLVDANMVEWEYKGDYYDSYRHTSFRDIGVRFSEKGKKVIAHTALVKELAQSSKATETSENVNQTSTQSSEGTKSITEKIATLKVLMNYTEEGITGWNILKKVQEWDTQRFGLTRYFFPGVPQTVIQRQMLPINKEAFQKQLQALNLQGLLTKREKSQAGKTRWTLTEEAANLLARDKKDPIQACQITADDMKTLMKTEISRLEKEKKQRQGQIQTLEDNLKQSMMALVTLQAQYGKEKEAAIATYDQAQQTEDASEKDKLKMQASEKALSVELLDRQITLKQDWNTRFGMQVESAKMAFSNWMFQTHQRIKALQETFMQLETAEVNHNILELLKETQAIEAQQHAGNEGMNAMLASIMGTVQGEYGRTQQAIDTANPDIDISANRNLYDTYLEKTIQNLKSGTTQTSEQSQANTHQSPIDKLLAKTKSEQAAAETNNGDPK